MECSFGLTGEFHPCTSAEASHTLSSLEADRPGSDFVLLASDTSAGRSIIQMKSDENKIKALGPHLAMAYGGEPGDTNNFADYVERNMRLYHIR
jgi:hypothetical protein